MTSADGFLKSVFQGKGRKSYLAWIVLGLVAGFIGSRLVNKTREGILLDIVLGIVGAVVGGLAFQHLWRGWFDGPTAFPMPQE